MEAEIDLKKDGKEYRLSGAMVLLVLVMSAIPLALILLNALPGEALSDRLMPILDGANLAVALAVGWLAMMHYRAKGETAAPVLGMAYLAAVVLDLFHTLGGSGIWAHATDAILFSRFSWGASRIGFAVVLVGGCTVFLLSSRSYGSDRKRSVKALTVISLVLIVLFSVMGIMMLRAETLPEPVQGGAFFPRPLALLPAIVLLIGLAPARLFYEGHPNVLAYAIILSLIPHIASDVHMVFVTGGVGDPHFVAAHLLKLLAYGVPLAAFIHDYQVSHALEEESGRDRASEFLVRRQTEDALTMDRGILLKVLEQVEEAVCIKDVSLRYTRVNRAQCKLMGLSRPMEALGKQDHDLFTSEYAAARSEDDRTVLQSGEPVTRDQVAFNENNNACTLAITKLPLKNSAEETIGILTVCRRIS